MSDYAQEYGQPDVGANVRDTQIPRELARQNEEIEFLHRTIGDLESRLAPVALERPEKDEQPSQPQPVMAEIAGRISGSTDAITHARRRIENLLDKLEV